ncbi:DEAD/DEAH box helicase [Spelaeicoccus albus]|uniref:RNA helicase n=1 Tax=Spelaeicoccus albus TaxID=1280376 RepID=A0A7Z0D3C8_9MICO|nr:DEAD/DEAH box helicase [Spelaeicoccus albus]NYI68095.1 superfamily II DNA/RNA helicase [Spelaeicoccus albus]
MTLETTEELTPEQAPKNTTFADLGVITPIVDALAKNGITDAFPIQALTLPVALTGADIIGQAKTGTGKTLGFGIPALQRVVTPEESGYDRLRLPGAPQALIVAPTRELAFQVAEDLKKAGAGRGVRIVTIYGGRAFEPQLDALAAGVEIVVGTPGRLLDLYGQRKLNLSQIRTVVLDEADEMLDLGFLPDVERLIAAVPEIRQTMLFSATMPGAVISLARRYMTRPTHIRAADPDDDGATVKNTKQHVYRAHAMDKSEVVARVLQAEGRGRTIIFTRTKRTAAKLADELTDRGFAAGALHGDLGQGAREQAMRAFRHDKVDVLVATDVAARGIDVDDVTHVINYQCPEDEKTYLHRIGRTGRAGNAGIAITFVDWDDVPRWTLIDRGLDLGFGEPVETYSTSPHLYSDLGIPQGTKGRLPKDKRTHAGLGAEKLEDVGETGAKHSDRQPSGRDSDRGAPRGRRRGGKPRRDGGRGNSQNGDGGRPGSGKPGSEKPGAGNQRDANQRGENRPRRRRRRTNHSTANKSE